MKLFALIISLLPSLVMAETYDLPLGNQFYADNKVYADPQVNSWAVGTPASQGLNATSLTSGFNALKGNANFRAYLVARNGVLVQENYANGGAANQARNIHSASKSILSAVVGCAIREGKLSLNTTVEQALGSKFSVPSSKAAITVEHLLTMRSGISWTEDTTEYSLGSNRIQAILNLPQAATPGTKSNYSTGDATLLAAVLSESVGQKYGPYAVQELLGPLNITVEKWGIDPQGYYSGGCNFFITPREMLRFGDLYANAYYGMTEALVEQTWAVTSFTKKTVVDGGDYGYMWWLDINGTAAKVPPPGDFNRDGKVNSADYVWWRTYDGTQANYLLWRQNVGKTSSSGTVAGGRAWGWGKQMIYVWPSLDLVCVTVYDTANNVVDDDNFNTIKRYVLGAVQ